MKVIQKALLSLIAVLLVCAAPLVAAGTFAIDSSTSLFVSPDEPVPIQKAAQDLASDMQKVFGSPVQIVHDPAKAHATTIWISSGAGLPAGEAFHITWAPDALRLFDPGTGRALPPGHNQSSQQRG